VASPAADAARFGGVARHKQVYKITYSNGKIYGGSDDTGSTYTGSAQL
jgi:hypothetical protein